MGRTSKTWEREEIRTHEDAEGNVTEERTLITSKVSIDDEPDFIKIYTKMWLEFNQIPFKYRQLFFSLACRMSYCKAGKGQLVNTGKPYMDDIMEECGWKTKDPYMKGLKALSDCKAIRKVGRGVYQVNPSYAGRGEWKYNPRLERGGIKDLRALFEFADDSVTTNIVWADNGKSTTQNALDNGISRDDIDDGLIPYQLDNEANRDVYEVTQKEQAVVTETKRRGRKPKTESQEEKPKRKPRTRKKAVNE